MRLREESGAHLTAIVSVVINGLLLGSALVVALIMLGPQQAAVFMPFLLVLSVLAVLLIRVDIPSRSVIPLRRSDRTALPPGDVHFDRD